MWSYAIHDTQTGNPIDEVFPISGGWTRGAVELKTFVFKLRGDGLDDGVTKEEARAKRKNLFKTWERAIVVRWDGIPVYAGLIVGRPRRPSAGLLTVKHIDARVLLSKRFLFGVSSYAPSGVFDFTGYSARGVARQALYYGLLHPYSAAWPIHAEVGGAEIGSSPWAKFFHYDFQSPESILASIEAADAGPDIELMPEYRSNVLWWVARIGTPFLTGTGFEMRMQGDTPLLDLAIDEDALLQATGIFTTGRGSEQDMRVGQASLPVSVGVSRDYAVPYKEVDDPTLLNSLAVGRLGAVTTPRAEWAFNGLAADFTPSQLRPGSIFRVFSDGDEWEDDGWSEHRLLQFSGSVGSDKLAFEVERA